MKIKMIFKVIITLVFLLGLISGLKAETIDTEGTNSKVKEVKEIGIVSLKDNLEIGWNNPFNPAKGEHTEIEYSLKEDKWIVIKIYSLSGQLVKILVEGNQKAGKKSIPWDGKNENGEILASGLYLVNMQTEDKISKTVLVAIIK